MDASEIYSKRLNAKEVIFPKEKGTFIFPAADGRIKLLGGDQELSDSRRKSKGLFLENQHGLFHHHKTHFLMPVSHHVEPRVKLYSPREESLPIPLKYIDVSRTTRTNLDVVQERRIDDYWNIDGSRDLPDSWTGFTQFTLLEEKPPDGKMWSGWRLTKRQVTSRPDRLRPELWIKLGRNAELKEKQKWSNEKTKLDNARRLRGIYFIDPEDKEFKETNKNDRKKWETPMAPAMPCKTSNKSKHGETRGKTNGSKSKFACILEASESARLRMGESLPNHHADHFAGKGDNYPQHDNLVHKFIRMPQAMKIPAAKSISG